MENIFKLNNNEISAVCGGRYKSKTSEKKPAKPQTPSKFYDFVLDLTCDLPWLAMLAGTGISIRNGYSKTATVWIGIASGSAASLVTRYARNYLL